MVICSTYILFNGAMSAVSSLSKRVAKTVKEKWLQALIERRGKKVAAIALINKNVRFFFMYSNIFHKITGIFPSIKAYI